MYQEWLKKYEKIINKKNISIEEAKRNLKEIINLCKDDIKINNKDITAILDLEDLKSLILEASDKKDQRGVNMNIFDYNEEEFNKKLEEIFKNISSEKLIKELIECGLEIEQK